MIMLKEKQHIIISTYLKGKSQRAIARETGIDRKTIRKYIKQYEANRQELLNSKGGVDDIRELQDSIVEKPKYNCKNRKKKKLTDEIMNKIEGYLKENEQKRHAGRHKQQKKKIDIYEALKEDGYDISYTTVCIYVNKLLKKGSEAFIKAEYELGDVCEFDWGEVKLTIDGIDRKFQMAVFTSAKGNYRYAQLFTKQNTECFQESHALFFENVGRVYKTMVYDNMKVAVKKFVGPTEKEPTDALLKMSIYYGFKFRFCNVRLGNEKGHVERSVEVVRRKSFAKKDNFESLEKANEYLERICSELNNKPQKLKAMQSAEEILSMEKEHMLPHVPKLDTARIEEPRVDKYSTICVDTCRYSVPDMYVGKRIFIKIYSNEIICFSDNKKIAKHEKKLGFYDWSIKIEHYLNTLKRKPGSLASSTAMQQADPRIQIIYNTYYNKREKDFIELLLFIGEKSISDIENAIKLLKKINPTDITTEKIKSICNRNNVNYTSNNIINSNMNIEIESDNLLGMYKNLIPKSIEDFNSEVAVI
ncbi:IS21 family transposase [Haloimpatiens massiliensis]|uniref:IS21 family transposase n=1 Tax=Haloimpatiens massiliensis TaxID=1658110 RepID=UPI000C851394|nr:IS21 family transposase [Haloimpatiens massiliensis]